MITDRIQLAGLDAYFLQDPSNTSSINLGPLAPVTVRTPALTRGKQVEISGLQLLIEGGDLSSLFQFQFDAEGHPAPLMSFSVMKEMFSGLFADPFQHRVHNVAGYLDFTEGTLVNGKIMEINGIPTIVSIGREECSWVSKQYILPELITIDALAWELASSRQTVPESFSYNLNLACFDEDGDFIGSIGTDGGFFDASEVRAIEKEGEEIISGVKSFQITFVARVKMDSFVMERQLPTLKEQIGRPLLRAVNILELLTNSNSGVSFNYDIHSLTELQNLCSDFKTFETSDLVIPRIIASLDLSAVLVNSENEDIANNEFEFIELNLLTDQFTRFEAKRNGESLTRVQV